MRKARKRSKSGFYHTMIRGVNRQNIFYDDADHYYFKKLMKKFGKKYKIRYHAYVLMDNHVHLLFDDPFDQLSAFMQVLCSVYARYFNRKYDRTGHLFGDRFASETVENNGYLVICCRYILQNPQKAGICRACDYRWSSYRCYRQNQRLISTKLMLSLFKNVSELYSFMDRNNDDECLDLELKKTEKEKSAIDKIKSILGTSSPLIDLTLPGAFIKYKLGLMRKSGLSINTISRITGARRYLVQKSI